METAVQTNHTTLPPITKLYLGTILAILILIVTLNIVPMPFMKWVRRIITAAFFLAMIVTGLFFAFGGLSA